MFKVIDFRPGLSPWYTEAIATQATTPGCHGDQVLIVCFLFRSNKTRKIAKGVYSFLDKPTLTSPKMYFPLVFIQRSDLCSGMQICTDLIKQCLISKFRHTIEKLVTMTLHLLVICFTVFSHFKDLL